MYKPDIAAPSLIDTTTKTFLAQTLQKCHTVRIKYYGIILNVSLAILFFGVFGTILYYRHKNKPTEQDLQLKMQKEQEYILSKIRFYQEQNHKTLKQVQEYSSPIEGLPTSASLQM